MHGGRSESEGQLPLQISVPYFDASWMGNGGAEEWEGREYWRGENVFSNVDDSSGELSRREQGGRCERDAFGLQNEMGARLSAAVKE